MKVTKSHIIGLTSCLLTFFLCILVVIPIGKANIFRIDGRSMYPILKNEDYVIVSRDIKNINLTDKIVMFNSGNALVTHRLVKDEGEMVLTKGDANGLFDKWIPKSDIYGIVIFIIPFWIIYIILGILIVALSSCLVIWFRMIKNSEP